jgi:hypothetical protein
MRSGLKTCNLDWLRGLDSNQDNQIQSLVCYRLHYPGAERKVYQTRAIRARSLRLSGPVLPSVAIRLTPLLPAYHMGTTT